ncbi:MAG: hypothetical protein J6W52_07995 [Bacteroidaceae bacterium]|nr:hypothetical protein [Bacteroidaceae bacterium]
MNKKIGLWFEENQKKLNEVSNEEKAAAIAELREYVTENLKGRTIYGAHSKGVLGCDPVDYYIEKAWMKIYNGIWEWKDGRTLVGVLKRIASSLMQKQVKKYRNMQEGKSQLVDAEDCSQGVWANMVGVDVECMGAVPMCMMSEDGRMLTEEEAELENAYGLMLEVVKDKPEQVQYVLEVKNGGRYDDIAGALGIEVREVMLIERRVLRRLTAYRMKHGTTDPRN